MKKTFLILAALICLLPTAADAQTLTATLTGAAEVPGPGDPDGTGFAVIEIAGNSLRYNILAAGIATPTRAHVHIGASGSAGEILVTLTESGQMFGLASATEAQINQILANPAGFYVNVHNTEFPNGAIRGQLALPVGSEDGLTVGYFPVVAKALGAAGTNFVTDLRIVNPSAEQANVTLQYFASGSAALSAPTQTAALTIGPGEQAVINDVVASRLNASGTGALKIVSNQAVVASARIINDLRSTSQGTTGFFIQQFSLADARTSGILSMLSNASSADLGAGVGYRTNVGYYNPNSTPVTATLTARRSSNGAALGSVTLTIQPNSHQQLAVFQMLGSVPEADRVQGDFYISYSSSAPLFVYASVVDNKTGDSVYIQ
jgi:hypothetical protein